MSMMAQASLEQAAWTLATLGPFLLYRMAVHAAVAVVVASFWALVCMVGYLVWFLSPGAVKVLFLAALVVQVRGFRPLWNWLEYRLDLGLAALLAELVIRGVLPDRRGQLRFARESVLDRFGDPRAMVSVRDVVDSALHTLHRTHDEREIELPVGRLELPRWAMAPFVRGAGELVRAAIFARAFLHPEENLWRSAGDGIQLHASHGSSVARSALTLAFLDRTLRAALLLISLLLVGLPVYSSLPSTFQVMGILAPFLAVHLVVVLVLRPFAVTLITREFFEATGRRPADPSIGAELERLSEAYREIRFQQSW